jgi:uncharacterized membrane protein
MNFPDALFPDSWAFGAVVPLLLALAWCLRTAPWQRLADAGQSNIWLGTLVVLTLIWSMKAGVRPGLNLHLLGATVLTLMFGRQLAIIGFCVVLAAVTLNQDLRGIDAWQMFALNALVLAVFPVLVADRIRQLVERHLPANLFIYVFITAFFGAAVTVVATGLLASVLLWLGGAYPAEMLFDDYFPYYILLGFSEAWLNGAVVTLMVVYAPHWVGSFDDRRYLLNK